MLFEEVKGVNHCTAEAAYVQQRTEIIQNINSKVESYAT